MNEETEEKITDIKKRRQIRVSDEVYQEIQKLARPLADTPDSVLRRVFGLKETK